MMQAFVFVPMLAMLCVIGWILAIHMAHYFLVVVVSGASGSERVEWPDEPLLDWFWQVFYLGYLLGICLVPAWFLGRLLGGMTTTIIAVTVIMGLCFPIVMWSSLSAPSKWTPFWPSLVPRLTQRVPQLIGFFVWSAIPLAITAGSLALLSGAGPGGLAILPAAVALAAGWLIYARVLGRMAFILTFTKGPKAKRRRGRRVSARVRAESTDPWAVPEDEEPATTRPSEATPHHTIFGDVVGYDLSDAPLPPPPPPPPLLPDDDTEAVPLAEPEIDEAPEVMSEDEEPQRPRRRQRRAGEDFTPSRHIPEPKQPWDMTMVTFLFTAGSMQAWIRLTLGLAVVGGLWQAALTVWPE